MKKLLALTLLILSLGAFAQERFALVIGNADYQISPLANALNDAQDIALALEDLDFKVTLVENADRRTMRDAIYNFGKKLNKDTVGLFYYSGHAVQYHGENYLIPINAMSSIKELRHLDDEAVKSRYASTEMSARESQLNFIFLDACRNNPLPAESRGITQGLAKSQSAEGTLIAYSTSPGRTAKDGIGRNSPYTKSLLKQIYTPNQPIELMLKDVKNAVSNDTNGEQLPWYESSITGNFCFKTTSDGCAKNVITVIDNPYLEGLYDLDVVDLSNGDNYVGQIKDNLMHGKGLITYKSGIKYQGEFINGKRHGEGTITQLNGNHYEGNFIDDKRHGKGIFRWINGATMETEWIQDNRIYSPKPNFEGGRHNILFQYKGLGLYTYKTGAYYKGQFKGGLFNGYGTYVGEQGSIYKGQFENGLQTGNGTLLIINGDRYEGSFINGSLNGQGTYSRLDGQSYFGEFTNDNFHGQGVLTKTNVILEGQFKDGELHGLGSETFKNGSSYTGSFLNGLKHGKGTWVNSEGESSEVFHSNGKLI
jgi:hypothetical protein